ncbi:MAG: hypothetical protein PHI28_04720, partial [Mangrovibacterium sp.]|nr:hypothetical protein [Mangrovibacterium sp.]
MLILLGILVGFFILLAAGTWLSNRHRKKTPEEKPEEPAVEIPLDCCGAHEVCEVEDMLKNPEKIIYFEDEELDRYQGIPADRYNDRQIEEFREVLYTLNGDEIRQWLLS